MTSAWEMANILRKNISSVSYYSIMFLQLVAVQCAVPQSACTQENKTKQYVVFRDVTGLLQAMIVDVFDVLETRNLCCSILNKQHIYAVASKSSCPVWTELNAALSELHS